MDTDMEPTLDDHIGCIASTVRLVTIVNKDIKEAPVLLVRSTGDRKSWSGTLLPLSSLQRYRPKDEDPWIAKRNFQSVLDGVLPFG